MKTFLIILIFLTLVSFQTSNQKTFLIGSWRQYAWKSNNSVEIKKVLEDCSSKKITFEENGSYVEDMYCLKSSGQWYFNKDMTKLGFKLDTFNGMKLPTSNDSTKRTNIIILKLTQDTLIYGTEGYYGKDRAYGHDDWYFVRQK
jgi:hypothetical protein